MSSLSDHPDSMRLREFALGQTGEADSAELERHIADCQTCCQALESVVDDNLVRLVRDGQQTARPDGVASAVRFGFDIFEELGRGGMGIVYRARQIGLGRTVALKRLNSLAPGPAERLRFRREAVAAARLCHPNIVQVYDVGEQAGVPFLAMEFVDGQTLAEHLRERTLTPSQAAELLESLARAVDYAHRSGIIHRDLKPANVLLARDPFRPTALGPPKIADFGLAHAPEAGHVTLSGALLGTPAYMSPERVAAAPESTGPAADIYSLGAILYEMLAGHPAYSGATALETLDRIRADSPAPLQEVAPHVPADLQAICQKCMDRTPSSRYATAAELAEDLARYRAGRPVAARLPEAVAHRSKRQLYLILGALLGVLGLATWLTPRTFQTTPPPLPEAGLVLWLTAGSGVEVDDSGQVLAWRDQSAAAHDAVQPEPGLRPQLVHKALNRQPVLRFDGTDDQFVFADPILTRQEFTLVAVVVNRSPPDEIGPHEIISNWDQQILDHSVFLGVQREDSGSVAGRFTDAIRGIAELPEHLTGTGHLADPFAPCVLTAVSSAEGAILFQDSQSIRQLLGPLSPRHLGGIWRIGTQGGGWEFWNGDVAEILAYDRALGPEELELVWAHLRHRYGIPAAQDP